MALLQLNSSNPKLSYIISKKPGSMACRSMKNGRLFGWYSSADSIFNCYFKDHDSDGSYGNDKGDDGFSYFSPSSYNSPSAYLDILSEFFSSAIKKSSIDDTEGCTNTLTINLINVKRKYLDIFQKYFTNVAITFEEVVPNNFKITFSTNKSIKELLAFSQLFFIFNVLRSRRLTDGEIEKYIKVMGTVKFPYFIGYLFSANVLRDKATFNKHVGLLEANSIEKVKYEYGFLQQQRIRVIEKLVDTGMDVYDIGCGEGGYVKAIAHKLLDGKKYWAIDTDEEMRKIIERKYDAPNVAYGSLFPTPENDCTIILSEVIEHMEKPRATQFVRDKLLLGGDKIKKMIITSPNASFNLNYFDDDSLRHDDHKFEMTGGEFVEWVNEIKGNRTATIFGIGDNVNGIQPTSACVLE